MGSNGFWRYFAVATLAALLASTGLGSRPSSSARASASPVSQPSEDGALLLELAERLLAEPPGAARLLPGQIAAELTFDLPAPPGGRVLGSIVRTSNLNGTSVEVVLDAPGSAGDLEGFFDRAITARGWRPPPPGAMTPPSAGYLPQPGGFQQPGLAPRPLPRPHVYCREANGPYVTLTITPEVDLPNDVRIKLQVPPSEMTGSGWGACAVLRPVPPPGPGTIAKGPELVPNLSVPPSVRLEPRSTMNLGLVSYGAEAIAFTEMSVPALESHFAPQLRAVGWTRLAGEADEFLAWSAWRLPERDLWQGTLIVAQGPGQGRRTLLSRVDSVSTELGASRGTDGGDSPAAERSGPPGSGRGLVGDQPTPDPQAVRRLAERLLREQASGQATGARVPDLLAGRLPPDLPFHLAVPAEARLVGSLVRPPDSPYGPAEIVLDMPGLVRDVQAYLVNALVSQGWDPSPFDSGGAAGFQSAWAARSTSFCQEGTAPRLYLTIHPERTGTNDVRVTIQSGIQGPCWAVEPSGRFQSPRARIPPLALPPDAQHQPGAMTMGTASQISGAAAITARSVADLDAYFTEQLGDAGWTRIAGRTGEWLSWSIWDVPGEGTWRGLLLVNGLPGENRRALLLRVEALPNED